jgi:hypothetical protein
MDTVYILIHNFYRNTLTNVFFLLYKLSCLSEIDC